MIADRPACEAKTVEEKRERLSSDAEYQRLGAVLKDIDREDWETASGVATLRLSMLTGCRTSEIPTLRWEHVHLEAGELRLPDSKTGAKVVHLGDPAIAPLRGIAGKRIIPGSL